MHFPPDLDALPVRGRHDRLLHPPPQGLQPEPLRGAHGQQRRRRQPAPLRRVHPVDLVAHRDHVQDEALGDAQRAEGLQDVGGLGIGVGVADVSGKGNLMLLALFLVFRLLSDNQIFIVTLSC